MNMIELGLHFDEIKIDYRDIYAALGYGLHQAPEYIRIALGKDVTKKPYGCAICNFKIKKKRLIISFLLNNTIIFSKKSSNNFVLWF